MENGGRREGAGRKPKVDELKLIEQMDAILVPDALWEKVANLINANDIQAMKLWVQYRYGMPKQVVDNNVKISKFSIKDIYNNEETQEDLE